MLKDEIDDELSIGLGLDAQDSLDAALAFIASEGLGEKFIKFAQSDDINEEEDEEEVCLSCSGTGIYDDTGSPPCGACDGTGWVRCSN